MEGNTDKKTINLTEKRVNVLVNEMNKTIKNQYENI
jgi:hypothetical protein